jgi:hypothetical protein
MVAANAMMSMPSLLPVAAGAGTHLAMDLGYIPGRSREAVVFKAYSPDESSGVYDAAGEEIVIQRMGRIIDFYV